MEHSRFLIESSMQLFVKIEVYNFETTALKRSLLSNTILSLSETQVLQLKEMVLLIKPEVGWRPAAVGPRFDQYPA